MTKAEIFSAGGGGATGHVPPPPTSQKIGLTNRKMDAPLETDGWREQPAPSSRPNLDGKH